MITDGGKEKLIASFDNLTMAAHNLKATVASEGKRAFADGNTQDISELLSLMNKVNELMSKVNKLAPTFRSYRLDIATHNVNKTQATEIKSSSSSSEETFESEQGLKDIDKETEVDCYIELETLQVSEKSSKDGRLTANCRAYIKQGQFTRFILNKNQTIRIISNRYKDDYRKRLLKYETSGCIKVENSGEDYFNMHVKSDIQFKSANSLCSFVLGRRVRDGIFKINRESDGTILYTTLMDD